MEYRVISIGTLAAHPLWGEEHADVRTGHATSTLVVTDTAKILVNPSLPPAAMAARLSERTPVQPDEITHVFLTAADTLHRRALPLFDKAQWLVSETELEAVRSTITTARDDASDDPERVAVLEHELDVLGRCRPAPDRIVQGVDLFPLPGITPGTCGLLLSLPTVTVLVCGDAVATNEHLMQGKVLPWCADIDLARESFAEAVQIADLLIPGRDNIAVNPLRQPGL